MMTTKQEGSPIIKVDQDPKNHSQADSVLAREHPETQPFDEQSVIATTWEAPGCLKSFEAPNNVL